MASPREAVALATSLSPWQREALRVEVGPALSIHPRSVLGGCKASTSFGGGDRRGEGRFSPVLVIGVPRHLSKKDWDHTVKVRRGRNKQILSPNHS